MVLSSPDGMSFPHSEPVGVCPSSQELQVNTTKFAKNFGGKKTAEYEADAGDRKKRKFKEGACSMYKNKQGAMFEKVNRSHTGK